MCKQFVVFWVSAAIFLVSSVSVSQAGEVNVYSYRKPTLIDPMFAEFTKQTGFKILSLIHI